MVDRSRPGNNPASERDTPVWNRPKVSIIFLHNKIGKTRPRDLSDRRYFFSLENWLEVVLISLTVSLLLLSCSADPDSVSIARHAATAAIVLAWSEWITMVGRHPRLGTYNIYVTMFYKVTSTFVVFLL